MYTPGQLTRQLADDYRSNAGARLLSYNPSNPNALGQASKYSALAYKYLETSSIYLRYLHIYVRIVHPVELRNLNEESAAITLKKLMTLTRPEVKQRQQLAEMELQLGIRSPNAS